MNPLKMMHLHSHFAPPTELLPWLTEDFVGSLLVILVGIAALVTLYYMCRWVGWKSIVIWTLFTVFWWWFGLVGGLLIIIAGSVCVIARRELVNNS